MKSVLGLIFSFCLATVIFGSAGTSAADEAPLSVKAPNAIRLTLEANVGKQVTLKLRSGQDIDGKLAEVGPDAVHISGLKGMEFFDAVVNLDEIAAAILRVR